MVALPITTTSGAESALGESAVERFASGLGGELIRPGDEAYDGVREIWNAMIDRRPALVARCAGVSDVISAVNFAREHDLLVSVRGGGHNVAGSAVCDDGLMIDLSPMKGIRVDLAAMTARAAPGVVWSEFDRETQAFGLATTGGLVGSTGIAGYTLGGGYGWLQGKHGLACDNLISADLVTADGRLLRADEDENPDLFWALRGGGGNFGVVTSFEYRLHRLDQVLAGPVFHPAERAPEVLRFYREFTADAPDKLTVEAGFLTDPDGNRLVAIVVCYAGDISEGERVIEPVRKFGPPVADMIGPKPYTTFQAMFDEALPPGRHNYWKSSLLREPGDEALDVIAEYGSTMASPYSMVFLQHFHGAYSRVGVHETAYRHREPSYNLLVFASWTEPAESDRHIRWARDLYGALQPHLAGKAFPNFLGQDEDAAGIQSAYGENYDRLVRVKTKYDPTNFFRMNQNIKPGGRGGARR
ncbi:MAG: FAD-binding oxidoreductase [Rubrobacteraceae bacterium]